jgi:hypothetical protein
MLHLTISQYATKLRFPFRDCTSEGPLNAMFAPK